jgi:hypothetical protein
LKGDEGGDGEEILERSGAPEVSICSENEFPSYEKQDFQRNEKRENRKVVLGYLPFKAKKESD